MNPEIYNHPAVKKRMEVYFGEQALTVKEQANKHAELHAAEFKIDKEVMPDIGRFLAHLDHTYIYERTGNPHDGKKAAFCLDQALLLGKH